MMGGWIQGKGGMCSWLGARCRAPAGQDHDCHLGPNDGLASPPKCLEKIKQKFQSKKTYRLHLSLTSF
jgi:hypothetical protein